MIKINYKINKEQWLEGWDIYYSLYRQKWAYVRAGIFLIPLILFVDQVIKEPSYGIGWMSIAICLACMVSPILLKKKERRQYSDALDGINDGSFEVTVDGTTLTLETIVSETESEYLDKDEDGNPIPLEPVPKSVCDLSDKDVKCVDTANIIGIYSKKGSYIITKEGLSEEELGAVSAALKDAVGNRFTYR